MARTCPCDSGATYADCCRPLHDGTPAPTAERLMRSRYTAYVLGDGGYLLRTWHETTRPPRISHDHGLDWTGLEVLRTEAGGPDDTRGVVEFRAAFLHGTEAGALHEVSRFVRSDDGWQYVRGREVTAPALDVTSP